MLSSHAHGGAVMKTALVATGAAACLLLLGPGRASAAPFPFSCATVNAENIANGTAHDPSGYTKTFGGVSIGATTGTYSNGTFPAMNMVVELPPNGIICLKKATGPSTAYTVTFKANTFNTPVYLLVEETLDVGMWTIDVSGGDAGIYYIPGLTRRGGLGGPGGGDGGSCDAADVDKLRAGAGVGPGGGQGGMSLTTNTSGDGAGGGAGPTVAGGDGYGTAAGTGGQPYASGPQRLTFGGSGGGCGISRYSTTTARYPYAGGGGGGALVIAAGTSVDVGTTTAAGLEARGGDSTALAYNSSATSYITGGGGGGGLIRLVTPVVTGDGVIDVGGGRASSASAGFCGNSTYRGGCGAPGTVKFETYRVESQIVQQVGNDHGAASAVYSAPQDIVLAPAATPTATIANVRATFATVVDQVPGTVDFSRHSYESPTIHLNGGQAIIVTVRTTHVPNTAVVKVRVNTVALVPGLGTGDLVDSAGSPTGTGITRDWTASFTIPAGVRLGSIEAWVESVCLPGTLGCVAMN